MTNKETKSTDEGTNSPAKATQESLELAIKEVLNDFLECFDYHDHDAHSQVVKEATQSITSLIQREVLKGKLWQAEYSLAKWQKFMSDGDFTMWLFEQVKAHKEALKEEVAKDE